jgi:tripartite-type tricarboxylate transporter receptor subunit TctC
MNYTHFLRQETDMNKFSRIILKAIFGVPLLPSLLATVLAVMQPTQAFAQQYPTKPIRMILPFPTGPGDNMARVVGRGLSQALGQPVVIDNRPGAAGAIGGEAVIKSAPDGYTLFFATNTAVLGPPTFKITPPYQPDSFTPISLVGPATFFVYSSAHLPAKTLPEFVAYVKANPGKLNAATANSTGALATGQLIHSTKMDILPVPYQGEGPAIIDLVSGRVHLMVASTASMIEQAKHGKMRLIGTISAKRSPLAPDVPTLIEQGFDVSVKPWLGIFGPPNMPADLVARLNREVTTVLKSPEVVRQLAELGATAEPSTAAALAAYVKEQASVWKRAAAHAGIKPE